MNDAPLPQRLPTPGPREHTSEDTVRVRGSVEILCREVEFPFTRAMESPRLIVAFTTRLALEVADMRHHAEAIAHLTGKPPSAGSAELLDRVLAMLSGSDVTAMVAQCGELHTLAYSLNPDEAYPTDHLIDMLSSCVSAIRFGCDPERLGVGSRHAAAAAQHVWKQRYGVSLFDGHTPRWEKDWARCMLNEALLTMALPALNADAHLLKSVPSLSPTPARGAPSPESSLPESNNQSETP